MGIERVQRGEHLKRKMDDVHKVVFCKDCKYWVKDYVTEDDLKYYHGNKDMCIGFGEYKEIPMNADDFCSRGEKR